MPQEEPIIFLPPVTCTRDGDKRLLRDKCPISLSPPLPQLSLEMGFFAKEISKFFSDSPISYCSKSLEFRYSEVVMAREQGTVVCLPCWQCAPGIEATLVISQA